MKRKEIDMNHITAIVLFIVIATKLITSDSIRDSLCPKV